LVVVKTVVVEMMTVVVVEMVKVMTVPVMVMTVVSVMTVVVPVITVVAVMTVVVVVVMIVVVGMMMVVVMMVKKLWERHVSRSSAVSPIYLKCLPQRGMQGCPLVFLADLPSLVMSQRKQENG